MSRTHKGSKGPGYDYWGRRALSTCSPGKDVKKITNSIERHRTRQRIRMARFDELKHKEAF